MARLLSLFALPVALLVAIDLIGRGTSATGSPPRPALTTVNWTAAPAPSSTAARPTPPPIRRAVAPPAAEAAEIREARALLQSLRAFAQSKAAPIPEQDVDAVRALLDRRPACADEFIAALDTDDEDLRAFLALAFFRVEDRVLRTQLVAAFRATDRAARRAEETLADPTRLLQALRSSTDMTFRRDLLGRLGPDRLGDPALVDLLLSLAAAEEDREIRVLAISRLALTSDARGVEFLLALLVDTGAPPPEREAAAAALDAHPDARAERLFLHLLTMSESGPLLRFAASGLRGAGDLPGASEALRDLFLSEDGDRFARRNAATSLVAHLLAAGEGERSRLEPMLLGAIEETVRRDDAPDIVAHAVDRLRAAFPGRYDGWLQSVLDSTASADLRRRFTAPAGGGLR